MKHRTEEYFSIDIEADGKIPGASSMLSFGCQAYSFDGEPIGTFYRNLELLEGAVPDPETTEFWKKNQRAYDLTRTDLAKPEVAMADFVSWVDGISQRSIFVAYPCAYDFMWIYWYMIRFVGRSPFSHSALDIKTLAMIAMGSNYRDSTKRNMPKSWFPTDKGHTHHGLDDAQEQGELFFNIRKSLTCRA